MKETKYKRVLKQTLFIKELIKKYFQHSVGRASAALAYYLIFSFFPLLIFITMLLSFLDISTSTITKDLGLILPNDVIIIINFFIHHIVDERSQSMLIFGLFFSIYFPMRAVNSLVSSINTAYNITKKRNFIKHNIIVFIYTLFLMASIIGALAILIIGENLLTFMTNFFNISLSTINTWNILRFIILACVLFIVIALLYYIAPNEKFDKKYIWPGTLAALISWLVVSAGFSYYVENMSNYSVIYGSIGAIIVLLMWLYFSAVILIMGAEFNHALIVADNAIKKLNLN